MIRNPGSSFSPKGLKYWCPAANVFHANATINLDNISADMTQLILALGNGNCRFIRPGWLFSLRTYLYLIRVRDSLGNYAFRDEMTKSKTFWGWPFQWTIQIPSNLGGGTNESEITLADFADVVIGETLGLQVDVSSEAAYFDGSNVVAAFSNDQTVIRLIQEHDLVMRHEESIAMLDQVKWA
jgi:HK97 family phage major capsid protein